MTSKIVTIKERVNLTVPHEVVRRGQLRDVGHVYVEQRASIGDNDGLG